MRYETVQNLSEEDFKRSTGVQRSSTFHLPSKKALHSGSMALEIILVDATEQPVERTQKTAASVQRKKRNVIPGKRR